MDAVDLARRIQDLPLGEQAKLLARVMLAEGKQVPPSAIREAQAECKPVVDAEVLTKCPQCTARRRTRQGIDAQHRVLIGPREGVAPSNWRNAVDDDENGAFTEARGIRLTG
jgi:hypothetical protein